MCFARAAPTDTFTILDAEVHNASGRHVAVTGAVKRVDAPVVCLTERKWNITACVDLGVGSVCGFVGGA